MQTELNYARPSARLLCRKCCSIAKLKVIEPFMFRRDVEAMYQCEKCGTVMKRRLPGERPSLIADRLRA
jgi:uncharacterized Zn finger protein